MSTVNLHLTSAEEAGILNKRKGYVFKDRPWGKAGDTFSVDGRQFELIDVSERSLNNVSQKYHTMDGYATPSDFLSGWKTVYGSEGDPGSILYIHWFRDITKPESNDLI